MGEIVLFLILLITSGAILVKREKPFTPEETVKAYYEIFVHENLKYKDPLCLTDVTATEILERVIELDKATIRGQFEEVGIEIDDERITNVVDARRRAFKKLEGKAELFAIDGDVAQIKLTSTYFKDEEIYAQVDKEVGLVLHKLGENATKEERMAAFVNTSLTALVKYYDQAKVQVKPRAITVEFHKNGHYWIPKDVEHIGDDIYDLVMGYTRKMSK